MVPTSRARSRSDASISTQSSELETETEFIAIVEEKRVATGGIGSPADLRRNRNAALGPGGRGQHPPGEARADDPFVAEHLVNGELSALVKDGEPS